KAVERALAASLDLTKLDAVLATASKETLILRLACTAFACYVTALFLWIALIPDGLARWPYMILGFAVILLSIVVEFAIAYKKLELGAPWGRVATMLLSFPTAMKAPEPLCRDLCAGIQPLAVAHRLCKPEHFEKLA